eukprot:scaffold92224_cov43-Prasinocladus_malaysianus.AAC.1
MSSGRPGPNTPPRGSSCGPRAPPGTRGRDRALAAGPFGAGGGQDCTLGFGPCQETPAGR